MKLAYNAAVLVLAVLLGCASVAEDERPIVVVFSVELKNLRMSRPEQDALSDYLTGKLAGAGVFQVVPRDQLKKRLMKQKTRSYKQCYDQSCQIELGRKLAAEKTLSTKVLKIGTRCTVSSTLYDLKKATADAAASVTGKCKPDDIVASMDKAVDELTGESKRAAEVLAKKDEARSKAEAEERERPARVEAERKAAAELRKQGIDAYKKNQFSKAVSYYKKALKLNPRDYDLYRFMGSAHARMGNRREAYKAYKKYVHLCPRSPYAGPIRKILNDYEKLME